MSAIGLGLSGVLCAWLASLEACTPKTRESVSDAGTPAARVETASDAAAAPAPACQGPEFEFRDQDRLVWATRGPLRRRDGAFEIQLGAPLIFSSTTFGRVTSGFVTLVCTDCNAPQWEAFEAGLTPLLGKNVRAKGIVRPAWSRAGDAGLAKDAPAVQLSTTVRDVVVLSDTEPATAPVCGAAGNPQ